TTLHRVRIAPSHFMRRAGSSLRSRSTRATTSASVSERPGAVEPSWERGVWSGAVSMGQLGTIGHYEEYYTIVYGTYKHNNIHFLLIIKVLTTSLDRLAFNLTFTFQDTLVGCLRLME